jgi:hypothetical protein
MGIKAKYWLFIDEHGLENGGCNIRIEWFFEFVFSALNVICAPFYSSFEHLSCDNTSGAWMIFASVR